MDIRMPTCPGSVKSFSSILDEPLSRFGIQHAWSSGYGFLAALYCHQCAVVGDTERQPSFELFYERCCSRNTYRGCPRR